MDVREVVDSINTVTASLGRPVVVGVSGFGGSGKSTLTRELEAVLDNAVRLRGDDFLDPTRSHQRSSDWDGVERARLAREVFTPFRDSQPGEFRRFDWSVRALGHPEPLPTGQVLIVDLIGLFHPEVLPLLDITIWCDVELETAKIRGMDRDRQLGRDHVWLWDNVWTANEVDFESRFRPREAASLHYTGPA